MISVIGLKTSSSTQVYITNATTKKCVTSSAILLALFASSSRSCQLCADVPVDVSNTNACNSPSTWRCPLSAREIISKFLRDRQVAVNHREMFCWFSCSWGFKLKKECVDQKNFKNIVDKILPKLFGWTANWTLGSVLLCPVYAIVVLLVVLNCRRALNDDNTTTPNSSLSWAISERARCCRRNVNRFSIIPYGGNKVVMLHLFSISSLRKVWVLQLWGKPFPVCYYSPTTIYTIGFKSLEKRNRSENILSFLRLYFDTSLVCKTSGNFLFSCW